ncbi:hypothetical protein VNI00_001296 [Paramarasmius palmivorus]|uniref:Uncharacterized protein n=1 Tax=Paramarasmius palmivorus TaxID=297713 RepID=A0AAW0E683_9AGAR
MLTKGSAPLHDCIESRTFELATLPAPPAYTPDPAPQTPTPANRTVSTATPTRSTPSTASTPSRGQQTPRRHLVVEAPASTPRRRESTQQRGSTSRDTDDDLWANLEDVTTGLRPSQEQILDRILGDGSEDDDDVPDVTFLLGEEWVQAFRGLELGPWTRMYLQTHKFGSVRARETVLAFNSSNNNFEDFVRRMRDVRPRLTSDVLTMLYYLFLRKM